MEAEAIQSALLQKLREPLVATTAFIGIDGYVDRIQRVVQSKSDAGVDTYFPSLTSFGQHVAQAAGRSTQVEIVSHVVKAGGNAPIMAQALARLGIRNTCLGTFGDPVIHPVFQEMDPNCQLLSVGEPAMTNAVEFDDGKLLLSEVAVFDKLDWPFLKEKVGLAALAALAEQAQLLALVDWSNLPHATGIWAGVLREIIVPNPAIRPSLFFDLCDLGKKTDAQIREVLKLISDFGQYTEVTLGLNANEADQLYHWMQRERGTTITATDLVDQGRDLFAFLGIEALLIHPIDSCLLFRRDGHFHRQGRLVAKPLVSTGGGDNFNAGYCFGRLQGFGPKECMEMAMATSGAYVQYGRSPDLEDLITYLQSASGT